MQFLVILHAHMDPWRHPTIYNSLESQAHPHEKLKRLKAEFECVLNQTACSGELLGGAALGDPAAASLLTWGPDGHDTRTGLESDVAGVIFFECESRARAEAIAARMTHPGGRLEVRDVVWSSGLE